MARSYGRVLTSIWRDDDYRALGMDARLMYVFLLSQDDLDHAGVIPLRVKRWSKSLALTTAEVEKLLAELNDALFTVTDDETEELLVRSLMRRDDVWKQPNVFKAGAAAAVVCGSTRIKGVLLTELMRIDLSGASAECRRIGEALAAALEPFGDGSPCPPEPFPNPSRTLREPFPEPLANPPGKGKEIGRSSIAGVINHLPVADARPSKTDDDGSMNQVTAALAERAGQPVTEDQARAVIAVVLDRAVKAGKPVHHPIAYVLKSIKAEHDVYDLLLADVLAAIEAEDGVPQWCGDCDERTRMREKPDGTPYRCPDCGPKARAT